MLLPPLNAYHSWLRGMLMASRDTGLIYRGMGLNLCIMAASIGAGVAMQGSGVLTAVAALVAAVSAEILFLRRPAAIAIARISLQAHAIVAHRTGGEADGRG